MRRDSVLALAKKHKDGVYAQLTYWNSLESNSEGLLSDLDEQIERLQDKKLEVIRKALDAPTKVEKLRVLYDEANRSHRMILKNGGCLSGGGNTGGRRKLTKAEKLQKKILRVQAQLRELDLQE